MEKFLLPELKTNYFNEVGSKNKVEQLIVEEVYVDYFYRDSYRGYVVILVDEISICITSNKDFDSDYFDYILLSNKKAIEQLLQNEEDILLKRWLKHPKKRIYTIREINESWSYNFLNRIVK